jgi:hypothetical protein
VMLIGKINEKSESECDADPCAGQQ